MFSNFCPKQLRRFESLYRHGPIVFQAHLSSYRKTPSFTPRPRAYYSTHERDGRLYLRRWQTAEKGEEIYAQEWQVDYVMGSGDHVRTYLHRSANGTLIELPLAWYSEKGGYLAMSPGYDTDQFIAP